MKKTASDSLRFLDLDGAKSSIPWPIGEKAVLNKEQSIKDYISYMLDRTNAMFEYEGLPDTIPAYMLELYLQVFGYAAFVKVDDMRPMYLPDQEVPTRPGVYIFYGGIGGERDVYYRPKLFTVANPRIKTSVQSTILYPGDSPDGVKNPCVIMPSDHNYQGLLPLFNRYAQQLAENDISIRSAQINARAQIGICVSTDRDKETARKYLDDLEAGKLGVLSESAFLEGVTVSNVSTQSANVIIQLMELQQYLKASWYNELGLNVNFNMKREYMSEEEIAVNTDILLPLIDDMLRCREEACRQLNEVFGLDISVRKSSAWANKEQEELAALAEASNNGQIPLSPTIEERIDSDDKGASSEEVQAEVQSTKEFDEEYRAESRKSEPESADTSSTSGPAPQGVEVNITLNMEGGEVSVDKPEAQEEPKEPDAE